MCGRAGMLAVAWSSSPMVRRFQLQTSSIYSFSQNIVSDLQFSPPRLRAISLGPSKVYRLSQKVVSQPQNWDEDDDQDEDEDLVIGDCVVFEEGVFDGSILQTSDYRSSGGERGVSPENLIPDEWLDAQKEINITKKERRKLVQEMEYCRRVDKRRQAVMPVNLKEYEDLKREKLHQLSPVVLDKPTPNYFKKSVEQENSVVKEKFEEASTGRVRPRNPRLAVYGRGTEDISALFQSGKYVPGSTNNTQGTRKLFSKEEKILVNRRVPDLTIATSGKWHPLHSLAASGEFYLATSLLKHGVDVNSTDQDGLTALHKSILGKKQAIFNFLLRESANPFVRDNDGATLMHYAVRVASSSMIKILLLYNVDINLQDNDGWTPLHLAVQSLRTDIVRLLLIKGADKTIKNTDGLTAVDLCLFCGRNIRTYELIKLLKRTP